MMKKIVLWCGFVLWMEGTTGDYQPIVGYDTREDCIRAIKVAKTEFGVETYLTCFPAEFDPRKLDKDWVHPEVKPESKNPAELAHP